MTTVQTTTVTQSANETLGTKEKKLYYLIIETDKGKLIINVGEKTHDEVKKLTEGEPVRPVTGDAAKDKGIADAKAREAAKNGGK